MGKTKKIVLTLVAFLFAIPAAVGGYLYFKLNSMYVPDEDTKSKNEEIKEDANTNKDITNILLVGVDGDKLDRGNRSDSMMILTIDNKHKNLKLTSLARDTYVDIEGYSTEKLTHAYAYEGPELLLDTIESNFELDIDKYVTVNFASFIDIIDIIGGVEVEVTSNDLTILNNTIPGCYVLDTKKGKAPIELVKGTGKQHLNGYQALAFSRIRYQDSAYARDARQREVVEAALVKVQKTGIDEYIKMLDSAMKNTKTNLSPTDLISLGYRVLKIGQADIKSMEFPVYKNPANLEGKGWIIKWDKDSNLKVLNDFIFNNIDFEEE
ncbi:LytR family transcriptional regulator [Romboutsia weinsteinii]|uniref:LytR family transcriptional regulator n=1 Tax=Romboutsia weinsteinii TaxID=2020949 RepID=A0A371J3Z6_9FIRM|nr:LCP family protein [Romboutsia weinsteinii]RDY27455.1 LytR family transcriptional regulator [Romboutsia weinsteinii]